MENGRWIIAGWILPVPIFFDKNYLEKGGWTTEHGLKVMDLTILKDHPLSSGTLEWSTSTLVPSGTAAPKGHGIWRKKKQVTCGLEQIWALNNKHLFGRSSKENGYRSKALPWSAVWAHGQNAVIAKMQMQKPQTILNRDPKRSHGLPFGRMGKTQWFPNCKCTSHIQYWTEIKA